MSLPESWSEIASTAWPARYGGTSAAAVATAQRGQGEQDARPVGAQQGEQVPELPRAAPLAAQDRPEPPHSPATSRSGSSRVRKTWPGRPFSAISR